MAFTLWFGAFGKEGLRHYLGDDGADFAHGGTKAVASAAVTGRETFAGNDESCLLNSQQSFMGRV